MTKVAVFGKTRAEVLHDITGFLSRGSTLHYISAIPQNRFHAFNSLPNLVATEYQLFLIDTSLDSIDSSSVKLENLVAHDARFNCEKITIVLLFGSESRLGEMHDQVCEELDEYENVTLMFKTKIKDISPDDIENQFIRMHQNLSTLTPPPTKP